MVGMLSFFLFYLCSCCTSFVIEGIVVSLCAEYKDEDLIPKNTSVVVARIPIKRPNKSRPRYALHVINYWIDVILCWLCL